MDRRKDGRKEGEGDPELRRSMRAMAQMNHAGETNEGSTDGGECGDG
jgi:flagellar biosynthesis protein FlhB